MYMVKTNKNFYVDPGEKDMVAWCNSQRNLSESVRRLIKNAIAQYGIVDYQDALNDRLNKLIGIEKPEVNATQENRTRVQETQPVQPAQPDTQDYMRKPDEEQITAPNKRVNLLGLGDDDN